MKWAALLKETDTVSRRGRLAGWVVMAGIDVSCGAAVNSVFFGVQVGLGWGWNGREGRVSSKWVRLEKHSALWV